MIGINDVTAGRVFNMPKDSEPAICIVDDDSSIRKALQELQAEF